MTTRIYNLSLVIFLAACLFVLFAEVLPNTDRIPLLFLFVAFKSFLLFILGVLVFSLTIIGFILRRMQIPLRLTYIISTIVLACICITGSFITSSNSALSSVTEIPPLEADTIRILSWNTDKAVDKQKIIQLAKYTKPDIIVLPEEDQTFTSSFDCSSTALQTTKHLGKLCEIGNDLNMNIYFWPDAAAQTLFVSRKLGDYKPINPNTPPFAGFYAEPTNKDSKAPKIIVAHLQRPDFDIGTSWWHKHVDWAKKSCSTPLSIAVGDFNATSANMRSPYLGTCRDITDILDSKAAGTWPSFLPPYWGAPIDHVYIGSDYTPVWFSTLRESHGSQHRPIFAIIKLK